MISPDIQEILAMLSYRRPMGSQTEANFIDRFLKPLGCKEDPFGNLYLQIGDNPIMLWASHTDSVHRGEGKQKLRYDPVTGMVTTHKKSNSSCLGADDAAGVWIMMEMIRAKVPGLYVFHYGEENGCIGSGDLVTKNPDFVKGIKSVVSFDRYGTTSIITHQSGTRTCSDAFANSFAKQLMAGYKIDTGGSLTDSREYRHLVSECTNISVGYYAQHTSAERQDVNHLIALRNHMVLFDESAIVFERDPKKVESLYSGYGYGGGYGGHYGGYGWKKDKKTGAWKKAWDQGYATGYSHAEEDNDLIGGGYGHNYSTGYSTGAASYDDLDSLFWAHPEDCATVMTKSKILESAGLTFEDFAAMVISERDARRNKREQDLLASIDAQAQPAAEPANPEPQPQPATPEPTEAAVKQAVAA